MTALGDYDIQRRGTALVLAAIGAVVVFLLSAVWLWPTQRGLVGIVEATVSNEGRHLGLSVESCNGSPQVLGVVEDSHSVRVRVISTLHSRRDSCADAVGVVLKAPLGDRAVIDGSTGREILRIRRKE